jgi:molecular chaperone DnaJ
MPTTQKDYYAILGIKTATDDEIRKAFRKLTRKQHPDVNPGDKKTEKKFKEISEANDILSDEKKRKIYDQFGFYSDQIDPAAAEAAARAGQGGSSRGRAPHVDLAGLISPTTPAIPQRRWFAGRFGSFRDIFSGIFSAVNARAGRSPALTLSTRSTWISGPPFAAALPGSRSSGRKSAPPAKAKAAWEGVRPAPSATAAAR